MCSKLFDSVIESLLTESNKSVGKIRGGIPDNPSELSFLGNADPDVKKNAEHGFTVVQHHYRTKLKSIVDKWVQKKSSLKEVKDSAFKVMFEYFERAYLYGLRSQAGTRVTPKQFKLKQSQYQWLRKAVDEELDYFLYFIGDSRELATTKINDRIQLYANSLRSMFLAGIVSAVPNFDYYIFEWIIDKKAENCKACQYLQSRAPFTIENLPCTPRDGSTICLFNCKCTLKITKVTKSTYERVRRSSPQKKNLLAQLKKYRGR